MAFNACLCHRRVVFQRRVGWRAGLISRVANGTFEIGEFGIPKLLGALIGSPLGQFSFLGKAFAVCWEQSFRFQLGRFEFPSSDEP